MWIEIHFVDYRRIKIGFHLNVYYSFRLTLLIMNNRDDLVHGFILVYSTKRKASLATLVAFSQNIPNLPIQILAVTETGGAASAFFSSELSHQLITAGNAAADRLQVGSSLEDQLKVFFNGFKILVRTPNRLTL